MESDREGGVEESHHAGAAWILPLLSLFHRKRLGKEGLLKQIFKDDRTSVVLSHLKGDQSDFFLNFIAIYVATA